MGKANKRWRPILIGALSLLVAAGVIAAVTLFLRKQATTLPAIPSEPVESEEQEEGLISYKGAWYAPKAELETMLFMGVDKFESDEQADSYTNSQQADFLLLMIFDKKNETYSVLQLNRDTITQIPVLGVTGEKAGTIDAQLALAHTYGSGQKDSCRNTVEAVSNLLYGIEIDHYMSLTMDAVKLLNDYVGGVTVEILDDFSAVDASLVQGQTVTLHGDQALTYVRSRGGVADGTNVSRMNRQRQYMDAFQTAFLQKTKADPDSLASMLLNISPYMVSDCTLNQLQRLYERMNVYDSSPIQTVDGDAKIESGVMAFYPDEADLRQKVIELFYEQKADQEE